MGRLFDEIRSAVVAERYVVSEHAARQLDRRRIESWQIAAEIAVATLLAERPHSSPNPSIELDQTLADGTPVKVVWSLLAAFDAAKLITVHFYDR